MKILIAETDPEVATFCSFILDEYKIESQNTHTIEDTISAIDTFKPDKILICTRLQFNNSIAESCRGINLIHELYPSLPIIIISGFPNCKQHLHPSIQPIIIPKPFTQQELHLKRNIASQEKIIKLLTKFYDTTQTALEQQKIGHTDGWDLVQKVSNKIEDDFDLTEFRS